MDLYARVNILGGKAVRLPRGSLEDAIALDADPVERAKGWIAKGADRLHIVDLDAAAYGDYRNRPLIRDLVAAVGVPVQVAGGARSPREVTSLFEAGAWRVVMGTAAVEDQVMVWDLCREHPGRIVVGIDVTKDEEIATRGWTFKTGRYLEEVLIEISAAGAAALAVAEVGRDALEEPPNYDALRAALSFVDEPVIAAGGVRNLDDLRLLTTLEADGKRLGGVIVGREVTAGRFSVEEAAHLLGGTPAGPWTLDELRSLRGRFEQERGEGRDVAAFLDYLGEGEAGP
jgi:phosphoribosylformimino-5-aminoimidazole carboxamide ribotide isomerase